MASGYFIEMLFSEVFQFHSKATDLTRFLEVLFNRFD